MISGSEWNWDTRQYLNYTSDVTHMVGEYKGPDEFGGYYIAAKAEYDPEMNKTRVWMKPTVLPSR